jgi:hypothetical protein
VGRTNVEHATTQDGLHQRIPPYSNTDPGFPRAVIILPWRRDLRRKKLEFFGNHIILAFGLAWEDDDDTLILLRRHLDDLRRAFVSR